MVVISQRRGKLNRDIASKENISYFDSLCSVITLLSEVIDED